ncbi:drebrin like [Homo sapiens]|uniref:Drebrin like n=1 Tax=Homo sapiens TaxID=9606 RepID=F8WFE1_HUMAN|nr:drebrin like [Homo sapiens]KAI4013619.1 drebrin like [Homo sapiens]
MAANLSRNGPALQEAYVRVVTEKSPTDWALFTYEGNSNDIRVAGTGDRRGRERCAEGSLCQPRQHHGQLPEGGPCDHQRTGRGGCGA